MTSITNRLLIMVAGITALMGCAGPSTPFGALDAWTPSALKRYANYLQRQPSSNEEGTPVMTVTPDRQILHDRSDLKLVVYDPNGVPENATIQVFFDGYDTSQQVFRQGTQFLGPMKKRLTLEFKDLRLPPGWEREITFLYLRSSSDKPVKLAWHPPQCPLEGGAHVGQTGKFKPPKDWVRWIETTATDTKFNPNLLAGLVAQESAFNPRAISWAKAIGLTQITPLADRELASVEPSWPRSPKIDSYPAAVIKTMISAKQLTPNDDYRLNPQSSVTAGGHYLDYLRGYWARPEHQTILREHLPDDPFAVTKVMLASYNSGAYRVKKAVQEGGPQFLQSSELKEARKYVSRVSSYCYHFAKSGGKAQ